MKKLKNILFIVIFLVAVVICFFIISNGKGTVANIYLDGELIESIDLENVKTSYTKDAGEHNTVLVEKGKISMHDADCPDKLCIKQGVIEDSSYPIVCLPNKIIIRITD